MNHVVAAPIERMRPRDFQRLATFIHGTAGIKMPPTKQSMVEGRLRRRLRTLGYASFDEYCNYLFDEGGLDDEAVAIIDAVTTNKTDFFREPEHFRFLTATALPSLAKRFGASVQRPAKIWSAACSTGAEPYTLAMVVSDYALGVPACRASILGTDICTDVLDTAVRAIYPAEIIAPIPMDARKRYLLRSKKPGRAEVRIAPELRGMVRFGRLNLMEETYPVDRDMDVIFCRNLLIYFDKPTQQKVLSRLCDHLRPGGYLFLGHSETIAGLDLPVKQAGTTVFSRI